MSTFTRSNSGINNAHLFHGVDYVLYVEGRQAARNSPDHLFWSVCLRNWLPSKRVHVKPIGSKKNVKSIARNIISRDLKRTLAAMDRDYDNSSGFIIHDNRVLYTYGYSIENDLLCRRSIYKISEIITRNAPLSQEITDRINSSIDDISTSFLRLAALDYGYFRAGHALLDRENPGKSVTTFRNLVIFQGRIRKVY